mgnify:CR=1 FL=1
MPINYVATYYKTIIEQLLYLHSWDWQQYVSLTKRKHAVEDTKKRDI